MCGVFCYMNVKMDFRKKGKRPASAFEVWVWRKIEKVKFSNKMKNEEVLNRLKEERALIREV